jgi:hypothetical protein
MRNQLAITLFVVLGLAARADAEDPKAEAKQHVAKATSLHREGMFAEALLELKTAYALDPQPQLLFAMGQLHVRLGQCPQAITFYERFLESKPARTQAQIAIEAIETCKTAPPPVEPPSKPASVTGPGVAVDPVEVSPPPPPENEPPIAAVRAPRVVTVRPWYTNYVADALVVGGVVSGVAGIAMFSSARQDRTQADGVTQYEDYTDLLDGAKSKQTYAMVLGGASVALIAVGAVHFMLADRTVTDHGVQITPSRGGGTVSWTRRF